MKAGSSPLDLKEIEREILEFERETSLETPRGWCHSVTLAPLSPSSSFHFAFLFLCWACAPQTWASAAPYLS